MYKTIGMKLKSQSGMALPMAIILLVVASFMVVPGLWSTGTMLKVNQELESSTVGYYAAKAGIADAYYKIKPEGIAPTFPYQLSTTVNGMAVEVSLAKSPTVQGATTTYFVKSTARLNNIEKAVIHASINVNTTTGYPFEYAIATTDGLLWVKNNANVNSIPNPPNGQANVFSNGALRKDTATGFINGKGYYKTTTTDCANITGGCEQRPSGTTFQALDKTWYWEQAKLGVGYPSSAPVAIPTTYGTTTYKYYGDTNKIKNLTTGVTSGQLGSTKNPTWLGGVGNISYIDGNLQLEKNFMMKGVLWVNGNISIEGLTYIYTDPNMQSYLLAHGDAVDQHSILIVTNSKIMATTSNLNLISDNGNITLESGIDGPTLSAPVLLGILYAPNGDIIINSNSDAVTSAIIGKSVTLDANVTVNYNTALKDNPPEGFELNVVSVNMAGYGAR